MVGRKPKPTALRELEGNPGHRPLNKNEPKPEGKLPDCPPMLRGVEKTAWRIVQEEMGMVLTAADQFVLAMFCISWGAAIEMLRDIRKHGRLVPMPVQAGDKSKQLALNIAMEQSGANDNLPPAMRVQNPAVSLLRDAAEKIQKFGNDLGLTPAARVRLKAESGDAEDPLDSFLNSDEPEQPARTQ